MESPAPELIEKMFQQGILLNKDMLQQRPQESVLLQITSQEDILVLNPDYAEVLISHKYPIDWYEIDRYRVEAEKDRDEELYQAQLLQFQHSVLTSDFPRGLSPANQQQAVSTLEVALQEPTSSRFTVQAEVHKENPGEIGISSLQLLSSETTLPPVESVVTFVNVPRKYEPLDFTKLFVSRFRFLEGLLRQRQELQNILPLGRLRQKKEKDLISVIGMVMEINSTKNGNIILSLEDLTGEAKCFCMKSRSEVLSAAKDVVPDEVIGVVGTWNDGVLFADAIVWPDVPNNELKKKGGEDEYAIFLSDIHVGSALFLREEFEKFLRWINGELGDEQQRAIAGKVRYILVAGDLVDGVGVYPAQESELAITNIREQYAELAGLLRRIPQDKQIILSPGNHDVVHLAEPQPVIYQEFAPELHALPNVMMVTNPALVNIGRTAVFPGFDVLLYHGYSFDYYVANVESIRNGGGYHRADLIMKFLLKRRHLAPSFRSTPYYPGHGEDPLLITKVPDFLVTGHIHYSNVANYRGVTMISCSCWQGKTTFQEKLGHMPEPSRLPIVNLKNREIKILRFG